MTETVVLDENRILTPAASRTHIELPFRLDHPADGMQIDFSYEPKYYDNLKDSQALIDQCIDSQKALLGENDDTIEGKPSEAFLPLPNLITIALDYEETFIGCAHRHQPIQCHQISAQSASPGFIPTTIKAGLYHLMMNAHCVLSNECRVSIKITIREAGDPA